jgi:hypothetical protein
MRGIRNFCEREGPLGLVKRMRIVRATGPTDIGDSRAVAAYVAELSGSLAAIARRHGLDTLGYILEMAREEAQNNSRPGDGGRRDP